MEAIRRDLVTFEEYLAAEELSDVRHEYLAGLVYAMAGASRNHNAIAVNLVTALKRKLRGGPCAPFMSDMQLRIKSLAGETVYYPDLMVACEESERNPNFVVNPTVIFEVISPSTERIDRREKQFAYRTISSLKQYVLIAQDRVRVESFAMDTSDAGTNLNSLSDTLALPALRCEISLAEIYDGVEGLAV
jgi:Uma2 family endonuclease